MQKIQKVALSSLSVTVFRRNILLSKCSQGDGGLLNEASVDEEVLF